MVSDIATLDLGPSPDLASRIAVAVMTLPWTHGATEDEHAYRFGDVQEAVAKALRSLSARLAEAERERDVHKRRGDNHWETLRGIRHIAREGGDLERIILWVNDAGRGYVETADKSLAQLADERNAAIAERDRLAGLVREAGAALKPFADVAEKDVGDDETDADRFSPIMHNRAKHITVGDLRRARALASRLNETISQEGRP